MIGRDATSWICCWVGKSKSGAQHFIRLFWSMPLIITLRWLLAYPSSLTSQQRNSWRALRRSVFSTNPWSFVIVSDLQTWSHPSKYEVPLEKTWSENDFKAYSVRVSTQAQRILKSFRKTLQAHTHALCASICLQSNAGHWSHDRIF